MTCTDCGEPITPQTEPEGVIYIRARFKGRWTSLPICTQDYEARRQLIEVPHRIRWDAPGMQL